ncbi:unnamed protein product [Mycena citricolor]|uniref:Uncharacterized protein n=1 Tax=Mycena citricolor TaxID=2018698 RepID=A0AAD2GVZ4_9AGAR|nr:unnamed protein product [Mycena citricolor]
MSLLELVLVGGEPARAYDLLPSTVFSAAYALLVPFTLSRYAFKRSRSTIQSSLSMLFAFRAALCVHPESVNRDSLNEYTQISFVLGYLSLPDSLIGVIRTVLVNATRPPPKHGAGSPPHVPPKLTSANASGWKGSRDTAPTDRATLRFWFRRWSNVLTVVFCASLLISAMAGKCAASQTPRYLRYASTVSSLVIVFSEQAILLWAAWKVPRVDLRAVRYLSTLVAILWSPTIYRVAVLSSAADQNSASAKAAFYIFQVMAEWSVACVLCVSDVRQICNLGLQGDVRFWDETPAAKVTGLT